MIDVEVRETFTSLSYMPGNQSENKESKSKKHIFVLTSLTAVKKWNSPTPFGGGRSTKDKSGKNGTARTYIRIGIERSNTTKNMLMCEKATYLYFDYEYVLSRISNTKTEMTKDD